MELILILLVPMLMRCGKGMFTNLNIFAQLINKSRQVTQWLPSNNMRLIRILLIPMLVCCSKEKVANLSTFSTLQQKIDSGLNDFHHVRWGWSCWSKCWCFNGRVTCLWSAARIHLDSCKKSWVFRFSFTPLVCEGLEYENLKCCKNPFRFLQKQKQKQKNCESLQILLHSVGV